MDLKKVSTILMVTLTVMVIVFAVCRGALVSESNAVKALETQGFSNIKVTHHAWFAIGLRGGGRDDAARFTCTAKNPAGKEVEVYVFVGWPFKGATVRGL